MLKKILKRIIQVMLIIISICLMVIWLYRDIIYPRKYKEIVEQASSLYNVDPNLIYAIIKQESKFNPTATSHTGAKGLMQLMDATAYDMARKIDSIDPKDYDIYDPHTNIFLGTKYISYLISHFEGNYYLAIVAYNAGMGSTKTWLSKADSEYNTFSEVYECIQYNETRSYLDSVIKNYNYYTILY